MWLILNRSPLVLNYYHKLSLISRGIIHLLKGFLEGVLTEGLLISDGAY